jgi:dihydrolipoamide dehydrogenase
MYDVVIIGAGPGGYVCAIRAAQLGLKVAIVEKDLVGGVCLNWGCIPTKALLKSADTYRQLAKAKNFGIRIDNYSFDLTAMVRHSRNVSKKLNAGVKYLLNKNDVELIEGEAIIQSANKVVVENKDNSSKILKTKNIVIATGARARSINDIEVDGELVWFAKNAMVPRKMPKSLLIVGAGAIGVEFASFYNTFGVKVTLVEALDNVLPIEDKEISETLEKLLKKQGVKIKTSTEMLSLKKESDCVKVSLKSGNKEENLTFDNVLLSVGIVGNVENLGLENTKVETQNSHIVVNSHQETAEPNIYAIGDVASAPWLAHKASHEGIICAEKIAGKQVKSLNPFRVPSCVYSYPQVASIGLTEEEADKLGKVIRTGCFPFSANGKAGAQKETDGFVKTVFDAKTGELLGAHMIGDNVTELIQGFAIAMGLETTEKELVNTIFPHPTLSEMMHESVLDAFDKAIHF